METDYARLRDEPSGTPSCDSAPDFGPDFAAIGDKVHPSNIRRTPQLLALDAHGRVLNWISWQDAACLYSREAIAWTLGEPCIELRGGISREYGERSTLALHPIIASRGHVRAKGWDPTPNLTNTALFARDLQLCMYCGEHKPRGQLTRDHVHPVSKGGLDIWENVVAACIHCNSRKGNRTPAQAHMPLLAIPYRPSWVEHLILSNRNILADQMEFLRAQLPKDARLRNLRV